jgi:hypothetical protein
VSTAAVSTPVRRSGVLSREQLRDIAAKLDVLQARLERLGGRVAALERAR